MESDTNTTGTSESPETQKKKMPLWLEVLLGFVGVVLVVGLIYLLRPPTDEGVEDLSWINVQNSGLLLVGTAADYPPFSYYDEYNSIDGFDAAMIREMGNRLGVNVNVSDYAFDGLSGALIVDQIDVAVAAISVTADRDALIDFTNVYFVTYDGILAGAGSDIQAVAVLDHFNGQRVGVQRGTVHETWAQSALVQGGHIPADNLFVYAKPVDAINDLEKAYIDLVIMDLQPADVAVVNRGVRLVGQGFNQQQFAMGVEDGANELRTRLNSALQDILNDGTLATLALDYLGTDEVPIPDPEECVNAMGLVKDLNYDDNDLNDIPPVDPGEAFQKGWRIQNTGTCSWDEAYQLKYVRGNNDDARMGGEPVSIVGEVGPGENYDVYVDLVAPDSMGEYIGYWQIHDRDEVPFGVTIWVAVEVTSGEPGVPTSTPESQEPTPTAEVPQPTNLPEPTPTPELPFAGKTFTFVEILEQPVPSDKMLEIFFSSDDEFNGQSACNSFSGAYEYIELSDVEGEIVFDVESITNKICDEPESIMVYEEAFLTALDLVEEYVLEDNDELLVLNHEVCEGGELTCDEDKLVDEELLRGDIK